MLSRLFTLVRQYPAVAGVILFLLYLIIFGFKSLVAATFAIVLILGFLYVVTDEDIDDDWFGGGNGPTRPA